MSTAARALLVTGGAGFIGSNFVRYWLGAHPDDRIVNLDKLTYAGNAENLADVAGDERYRFVLGDICDGALVGSLLENERIDTVVNFAAETHVDRSITGPAAFVNTNVQGTFMLLEAAREVWAGDEACRFLHVSTDEVYGSLGPDDPPFTERHAYAPNSPYSASKAAADHLVRAYHRTYGLPVLTTNCSNNYGPYQYPEKLIPLMILNALEGKPLPVYGDGKNIRDWLYVADHCSGIDAVLDRGRVGQTYNIGGDNEIPNIEIVTRVCELLDARSAADRPHGELVRFVDDRPGHDRRYAIDASKMASELGWRPSHRFEEGIEETVDWYLAHPDWCRRTRHGARNPDSDSSG